MAKQEEIREGIESILGDQGYYFPWERATQEIMAYLYSQGVLEEEKHEDN